jgi:predicted dehydrogenase
MKIGMCGVRGLGRDFLKLFSLHPKVESVAIADLDADVRVQACETARVAQDFETLDELLDADAVGIFTPPWTHANMTIQALQDGKHVIAACPVGLTLDELRAVVDTVEKTGKIYMLAETSYYYPAAMYARQAWAEGRFGDFVYGEGEYYYRPHAYDFWMRDGYSNMPPMLYPTHSTAMVVSVTGKRFERVTCVGTPGLHPDVVSLPRRPEWQENKVSNMTMLGQMSGGGACRINEMRNVGCKGEMGSILGTRGSIRQHSGGTVWSDGLGEHIDLTDLWRDAAHHPQTALASRLPASYRGQGMGHQGSHRFLADEFVQAVLSDRRPHNDAWMGAKYCAPGIVAWESLKQNGDWLEVPDFGEPSDGREPLGY